MYAYIKNGKLLLTSDSLFDKQIEEVAEIQTFIRKIEIDLKDDKTGEIIFGRDGNPKKTTLDEEYLEFVVIQPLIEGIVYDEVIETDIEGRICFENGKIVLWEDSEEKATENTKSLSELQEKEAEEKKNRPGEIKKQLGELVIQKNGMIELGEDTTEVEAMIEVLKLEYAAL